MMILLARAWAFDACPEPDRPTIIDFEVICEDDQLELQVVVEDENAPVATVDVEIRSADESLTALRSLYLIHEDATTSTWTTETESFDCSGTWLLRAIAMNTDGATDEEEVWLGMSFGLENGGFEAGAENWAMQGNAYDLWDSEFGIVPMGDAMLAMGWPENATYVYGNAWTPLGALPAGDYVLSWYEATVTDWQHWKSPEYCASAYGPFMYVAVRSQDFETTIEDLDRGPAEIWCDGDDVGGVYIRKDWQQVEMPFTIIDGGQVVNAWWGNGGGFGYLYHWNYIDGIVLTYTPAGDQAGVLPEDYEYLAIDPVEDASSWASHAEAYFIDWYADSCSDCADRSDDGKYGADNGTDAVFSYADGSLLIIEAKSTQGRCLDNTDDARTYRDAAKNKDKNKALAKCGYKPCSQDSTLWIGGTITDFCAEGGSKQTLARELETAWDRGQLYFSWAIAGTDSTTPEDRSCHDGWFFPPFPDPGEGRPRCCPLSLSPRRIGDSTLHEHRSLR